MGKRNKNHPNKGFTLIELLVVVSIIGLLSSIILTALVTARADARDAQRIANLSQMSKALTLYMANNGEYPVLDAGIINSSQAAWTNLDALLTPFIKIPVTDPATAYHYFYTDAPPIKLLSASPQTNFCFYLESGYYIWVTLERPKAGGPSYTDLGISNGIFEKIDGKYKKLSGAGGGTC